MTDNDLVKIARTIYRKHKAALDFIFEQRPDDQLEISEFAKKMASDDSRIKVVPSTKSYIRFYPNAWEGIPAFNATPPDQWTKTGHTLLFEIKNRPDSIRMTIVIGPTDDDKLRRRIFDFCRNNPDIFQGIGSVCTPMYTQIYSTTVVGKPTLTKQPIEDIKRQFESNLQGFMGKDFGEIVKTLAGEFT